MIIVRVVWRSIRGDPAEESAQPPTTKGGCGGAADAAATSDGAEVILSLSRMVMVE